MNQKVVRIVLIMLCISGFVFAAGQQEAAEQKESGEPLEFYAWDNRPDQIRAFCNDFAQENNEEVNVHILPNIGYVPALQTKMMGGTQMDVMYNFRWNQLRFYNLGWAKDLSGFEGSDELLEDILESDRKAYQTSDGKLISLPYFMSPFILMYNPSLLEKAGYDHYPTSKQELYQMCVDLKKDGVSSPYVAYWSKDFIDRYFFIYLISEGIQVFDDQFNPTFQNDPMTKEVFSWWVDMYQDGLTTSTILTDGPSEGAISIQEGRSAFFNLHNYFLKGIRESGAVEAKHIELGPQIPGKTGTTLKIGEVLQMGGNAQDPERAWELLKFYSWKNASGEYHVPRVWALQAGFLVPYKGFFESQEIKNSFDEWIDWDLLIEIVEDRSKIETVRMQVWYPDWRTEIANILHNMLLKKISIDDAIEDIADLAVKNKAEAE